MTLQAASHATDPDTKSPALLGAAIRRSNAEQLKALCVGLDPAVQELAARSLPDTHVVLARTADEAVRATNACAFDLYVLNSWLSDWSGLALCRHIRESDPHVPICLASSITSPENARRALSAGANVCVGKPVNEEWFSARITGFVRAAKLRNALSYVAACEVMQEEVARRLSSADSNAWERFQDSLSRTARSKGRTAYLNSGGTVASFERAREQLWTELTQNIAEPRPWSSITF